MVKKVAIIGGGAAGFFTAINLAMINPDIKITIYEASNHLLAKVLVSGGGRCNVTNAIYDPKELIKNYPRGYDFLEPVFNQFNSKDTQNWFNAYGVKLKTEDDGRIFPVSNSSQTIYNCLTHQCKILGISIRLKSRLKQIEFKNQQWELKFKNFDTHADFVVLATGSNLMMYDLLRSIKIPIVGPVPSLFTFNVKQHEFIVLAGISVPNSKVKIKEIPDHEEHGPLLITHWGFSGPAILRLSAWLAIPLAEIEYSFKLIINWNNYDIELLKRQLLIQIKDQPKQKISNWIGHGLPKRLWQNLFIQMGFKEYLNWAELGKKGIDSILKNLTCFEVSIEGKSTFKEEFVTAGGIDLSSVNPFTFAIEHHHHLYAVGELLNIDAITGGFNFQAAWSGSYVAAKAISGIAHK